MGTENKTFTVECTMNERWIPCFMSFLKKIEHNGAVGHSGMVAIFADGDGDFRPKFVTNEKYHIIAPRTDRFYNKPPEFVYDAQ